MAKATTITLTRPTDTAVPGPTDTAADRIAVGVDVGGTKTQITVMRGRTELADTVIATPSWRRYSETVDADDMANLVRLINAELGKATSSAPDTAARVPATLCVGLHGADTPAQTREAQRIIADGFPGTALVVNDAELISHAGDADTTMSLILGTGAIVVGRAADGTLAKADGYGWMLSDFGSAPSLARESVRAILEYAIDASEAEALSDPLGALFAKELDAVTVTDISVAFTYRASETGWGDLAPLVFQALEQGSMLAERVVSLTIGRIVACINAVLSQGAVGDAVVAAGGVITHQPQFERLLRRAMLEDCIRPMRLEILRNPPVRGALALARSL